MGSSGGSANPMFLSQGGVPMPDIPIAGQAGELKPQERGSFQEFLPEVAPAGTAGNQIMPAGQGPNPSATGLTAEMFRYRSPQGVLSTSSEVDSLRQQLAAVQAAGAGGGGGGGQFGAARSNPSSWGGGWAPMSGGGGGFSGRDPYTGQEAWDLDPNRQYFGSSVTGPGGG